MRRKKIVKVGEVQNYLGLQLAAGASGLEREISAGYCGDLLSDVIANAQKGGVWLTSQCHQNIVAVAVLRELAAIVLVNGRTPDEETRAKAEAEGIPLLLSPLSSYSLAGKLYGLGIGRIEE
jgi:serine kinase of HPr protein (carbohydrate metabolism regulator)